MAELVQARLTREIGRVRDGILPGLIAGGYRMDKAISYMLYRINLGNIALQGGNETEMWKAVHRLKTECLN